MLQTCEPQFLDLKSIFKKSGRDSDGDRFSCWREMLRIDPVHRNVHDFSWRRDVVQQQDTRTTGEWGYISRNGSYSGAYYFNGTILECF